MTYLRQHWPELYDSAHQEHEEQDVEGGEVGSPLEQGPEVHEHGHDGQREDEQEDDGPLEAVARIPVRVDKILLQLVGQHLGLDGQVLGRLLGKLLHGVDVVVRHRAELQK